MNRTAEISLKVLIALSAVFAHAACGRQLHAGSKWWDAEARFFDDGIDLLSDHGELTGSLAEEQQELLVARVQRADVVALVEILSSQTITDRQDHKREALSAEVVRRLAGQTPPDSLTLVSVEGSPGFGLLKRHEDRLMGRHLLFLRLYPRADGSLGHHFHLSPASDEMIRLVEELIGR